MAIKKLSLKLIDIYAVFMAIAETEKLNVKGIPFKLAWELSDVKEAFKKPSVRWEEERNKIFSDLGTAKDDNPGSFEIEAENISKVNKRIAELNDTEVEVEFNAIHLSKFETAKDFQFAPGAFETLRKYVIEFPKKEEKKAETKEQKEEPVEA
jgi:hypothetical protein